MGRLVTWIVRNADGLLALIIAGVVALITWLDVVGTDATNSATLLTLAVLAAALLRERSRQRSVEKDVRRLTTVTRDAHAGFDDQLTTIIGHLDEGKVALDNLSTVRVITGLEVTHALAKARLATDRWLFRGNTGAYMRAVTIPECVQNAHLGGRALLVRMEIVDPSNVEACRRVADSTHARQSGNSDYEPWTLERVRKESYATILAGLWWRRRYHLLDVEIGVSSKVTALRWDLSASSVIITWDNPSGPALMVERGHLIYDRFEADLRDSYNQATRVPIELAMGMDLSAVPTVDEARAFFAGLAIDLPDCFGDDDVDDIVRRAVNPKTPYAGSVRAGGT